MNITLVTVGKIKEKFYRDAVDEFVKRMSRYCKLKRALMQVPALDLIHPTEREERFFESAHLYRSKEKVIYPDYPRPCPER